MYIYWRMVQKLLSKKKKSFPFEVDLNLSSQPDFPRYLYVYKIHVNKSESYWTALALKIRFQQTLIMTLKLYLKQFNAQF